MRKIAGYSRYSRGITPASSSSSTIIGSSISPLVRAVRGAHQGAVWALQDLAGHAGGSTAAGCVPLAGVMDYLVPPPTPPAAVASALSA